jgi:hypothetical protein
MGGCALSDTYTSFEILNHALDMVQYRFEKNEINRDYARGMLMGIGDVALGMSLNDMITFEEYQEICKRSVEMWNSMIKRRNRRIKNESI